MDLRLLIQIDSGLRSWTYS